MTEDTQKQAPKSDEARMVKALEDIAHDVRGLHLMVQVWFTLFVIGAIIWLIVLANS